LTFVCLQRQAKTGARDGHRSCKLMALLARVCSGTGAQSRKSLSEYNTHISALRAICQTLLATPA